MTSVALVAAALLLPACAQAQAQNGLSNLFGGIFSGSNPAPSQAPPGPGGAQPWSGEDGASGHPLMTAAAIREAASNFNNCVAGMWPDAARRNITQENFQRFTAGLAPDLRIMDLMDSQPEFTKSIWDYLDILVNDNRLAKGREVLAKYKAQFDATEKATGVDRYIIASIWGIESNYSTQMGDRSVLQSTATLACIGRRQAYFKDEFLSALEILNRGDLRPEQMRGSWAGAFGPTQFMPTAFKRFAVDGDGDGRRDVVDNPTDLIASTANNLKKDGWQAGQTWGFEVVVPQGFELHAGGPRQGDDDRAVGKARPQARDGPALPAPGGESLSAGAGGRAGAGLPDASELPGHHEVQPGRGLCAGDRPFRRPPAWGAALRAALAAAGTGAGPHGTAGTPAIAGPARLLQGHPGRPVRRPDPGGLA
ncbi:membrane-bound lytic murein transglycosylase B [Bradyrhizobium diazoefficiens]